MAKTALQSVAQQKLSFAYCKLQLIMLTYAANVYYTAVLINAGPKSISRPELQQYAILYLAMMWCTSSQTECEPCIPCKMSYNKQQQTHLTDLLQVNATEPALEQTKIHVTYCSTFIITMRLFTAYQFPQFLQSSA